MRKFFALLAAGLCCFFIAPAQAQKAAVPPIKSETLYFADSVRHFEKMTEIGLIAGGLYYLGDLRNNEFPTLDQIDPVGGVFIRRHLWPNLAVRANLAGGTLQATDEAYPVRGYSFKSTVYELSGQIEWNIFGKRRFRRVDTLVYEQNRFTQYALVNRFRRVLLPYLYVNGAGNFVNAKANYNEQPNETPERAAAIREDKTASNGTQSYFAIGFGGGLNIDLSRRWMIGVELGARAPFSDLLDGAEKSVGSKYNDWFWMGAVNVSYRIGARDKDGDGALDRFDKCPDIPGIGRTGGCPDADNDGIPDQMDDCPRLAGIPALSGCPLKDADNDGIQDVDDECPDQPGLAAFKGCPDSDGDGVEDRLDSCKTVAGLTAFNGCPDSDGDGIEDRKDACPKEKGIWDYYRGCPVRDTDQDGVEDKLDDCFATPGKPDFKGCPDSDNDGVEDRYDKCPNTTGSKDNNGCPVLEKKDQEKLNLAVKAVKFETGKAILKSESGKILNDIAQIMLKYPDYALRIEGHTDNVGKDDKNQKLSEERATACAKFLESKGVPASRMKATGFGETKPVADNKTAVGKAANRRVEFIMYLIK